MFACYSRAIDSLPWKTSAFAVEGRLPSMGLCDRSAFRIEGPLPSKDFIIDAPLPCNARALSVKAPLPLPSRCLFSFKPTLHIYR